MLTLASTPVDVVASGALIRGETLSAGNTLTDADGLGAISYHWQRSDAGVGYADMAERVVAR